MEENQEQNLFDDFRQQFTQAGSGKRLANYIIDVISFYVFMIVLALILAVLGYDLGLMLFGDGDTGHDLLGQIISIVLYGMYMGLVEAAFKGRSLGKLITGTVAVNEDGSRISGQTALLRGLCRAVPFNALSALGSPPYPWHDRWTRSYVVNVKSLPQN